MFPLPLWILVSDLFVLWIFLYWFMVYPFRHSSYRWGTSSRQDCTYSVRSCPGYEYLLKPIPQGTKYPRKTSLSGCSSAVTCCCQEKAVRGFMWPRPWYVAFSSLFRQVFWLSCHLVDIATDLLGDIDKDLLRRARDVLADATIRDLLREDLNSPSAFRAAIRQQVVQLCIRLRVSLIVIDRLMAVSNSFIDQELK